MMNIIHKGLIPVEEVTSVDVLCGKSKQCFNHSGNRRFRFIVSFNLDRYKDAKNRKEKSAVVESVLRQICNAGGRFLMVVDDGLLIAPEKMAKEKISHALRDKTPLAGIQEARERLKQLLSNTKTPFDDYHYLVANERLLRVDLPAEQHAADDRVEHILTEEIERLSNDITAETHLPKSRLDSTAAMYHQVERVTSSSAQRVVTPPSPHDYREVPWRNTHIVTGLCGRPNFSSSTSSSPDSAVSSFSRQRPCVPSPLCNQYIEINQLIGGRGKSERNGDTIADGEPSLVLSDGEDWGTSLLMEQQEDKEEEEDEEEDTISGYNLGDDLPQNFTEEDCENLVAMLDYASSL